MNADEAEAQHVDNWGEHDNNEHQANDPLIDWNAYHTEKLSLPKNKKQTK